ncbi:MAG: hypothetical protein GX422_05425 [Deltaproteobacteria bacterium]|nr:hypothetical protein [Deltaproteobacteria bacterium]
MSNGIHGLLLIVLSALILMSTLCTAWVDGPAFGAQDQPIPSGTAASQASPEVSPAPADCRELAAMLDRHKAQISRELGQIRREIAALREDMANPGIKEVFAGIGYILGLAGVGFFVHARRERR